MRDKIRWIFYVPGMRFYTHMFTFVFITLQAFLNLVNADSQFSDKAYAVIQSCDMNAISGFATLKEYDSIEAIKVLDVYMHVEGLSPGKHAVHIHETASCTPCASASGHFDPGRSGNPGQDENHPYHSGDLINILSDGTNAELKTQTNRVTLSNGPLSVFDTDGSTVIIHTNEDSYCPGGEVAGCAGGSRIACGIIKKYSASDNFELNVSKNSFRKDSTELSNAEIEGSVYIYLTPLIPDSSIEKVAFSLDGKYFRTEYRAPYDLMGTHYKDQSAELYTNGISDGLHTISAEILLSSSESVFVSANFSIKNNKDSFGHIRKN